MTKKEDLSKKKKIINSKAKSDDEFVWRGIILLLFVFAAILTYGYVSYNKNKSDILEYKMRNAAQNIIESDNFVNKIYDLGNEEKVTAQKKSQNLPKQLYQDLEDDHNLLNKQNTSQDEIFSRVLKLEEKISQLEIIIRESITKKQLGAIISAYSNFRQKIYNNQDFRLEFDNFWLLLKQNKELLEQANELPFLLESLKDSKAIYNQFIEIQPSLLARSKNNPEKGLVDKLRYNLGKIFIIKSLKETNQSDIEKSIIALDELLKKSDYQKALQELYNVDKKYQTMLLDLTKSIENRVAIDDIHDKLLAKFSQLMD